MRWKFLAALSFALLSIPSLPAFAQQASSYEIKNPQGGQSYDVNYTTTGAVINTMFVNTRDTSLIILMNATSDGNIVIDLPRSLIDARTGTGDDQFIVLVDDTYTTFHETKTPVDRTLSIPFAAGSSRIEIIGTQVMPEFGSLPLVILAVSIVSIVILSSRNRLRFSTG